MKAFNGFDGLVVPLDRSNVDTDAIIAKQFIKSVSKTGYGPYLFDQWRYLQPGVLGQDCTHRPRNPDFVLNDPLYEHGQILLARENFGCGSSREHAVWALQDFGFRALIAPSYADIFFANCTRNGLLPIVLAPKHVDALFDLVTSRPGTRLGVDLAGQRLLLPDGDAIAFDIDAFRKRCLIEGLDEVALTLLDSELIRDYERRRSAAEPWMFETLR